MVTLAGSPHSYPLPVQFLMCNDQGGQELVPEDVSALGRETVSRGWSDSEDSCGQPLGSGKVVPSGQPVPPFPLQEVPTCE
jgi:hypothetical protein